MFKNHIDETIEVQTKKEMDKAVKDKYGTIKLSGVLIEEMVKNINLKHNIAGYSLLAYPLAGMLAIPLMNIIAIPTIIGEAIYFHNFIGSLKYINYTVRTTKEGEIYLLITKLRDKIIKGYKGEEILTAEYMQDFEDMIDAKVNNIYLDRKYLDDVIKEANKAKLFGKEITIDNFTKIKGYKLADKEAEKLLFVRIR